MLFASYSRGLTMGRTSGRTLIRRSEVDMECGDDWQIMVLTPTVPVSNAPHAYPTVLLRSPRAATRAAELGADAPSSRGRGKLAFLCRAAHIAARGGLAMTERDQVRLRFPRSIVL